MSGPEDDAIAETVAASGDAPERNSRELDSFVPGSTVGRYCLTSRLGAGAMGVVWSARDPQLDREIAIKLVHPEISSERAPRRLLLREARAMAKLSHRSVITVYDAGDHEGTLFLAMELIHGTNLGQLLRERDATAIGDWRRWLAMMIDAGRGLAEAHRNGVLHRDFKPDNVLVDGSGRVCVGDFGLASLGDNLAGASRSFNALANDEAALDMTRPGTLLGTPIYMSPQQLCGESIDARADQFAFCVATWEALYGTRPFVVTGRGAEAITQLLGAIIRGAPTPPSSPVPDAIRVALARGLAVDPEARWPDMEALLSEIEKARRPATVTPPRRRSRLWISGAAIAAVAVGVGVYVGSRRDIEDRAPAVVRKELFSVPLRTRIALSPDGRRLALAAGRLEIYDTASGTSQVQHALPVTSAEVEAMELEGGDLVFSLTGQWPKIYRWRYGTDNTLVVDREVLGWRGTTIAGDAVQDSKMTTLTVVDHGREVARWTSRNPGRIIAISPNKRHIAILDQDRFGGDVVVYDVTAPERVLRSKTAREPTALAWEDATTMLVADVGSSEPNAPQTASLSRITLSEAGLSTPIEVASMATSGWFGRLEARNGHAFAIEQRPSPNGHVVERIGSVAAWTVEQTSFERGAIPIGFIGETAVAWNRDTKRIIRYGTSIEASKAELAAEPANATMLGDVLIAALRQPAGREIVAVSLADGRVHWRHAAGKVLAVRCAADYAPPCFAIVAGDTDRIVTIDPLTGALGTTAILSEPPRSIEDISIHPSGSRLLVVGLSPVVREIDTTGKLLREIKTPLGLVRSVAYDPAGGILVGGVNNQNLHRNAGTIRTSYLMKWIGDDGTAIGLGKEGDGILLLVRPSLDLRRVSFVARPYEPVLVELRLP